MADINPLIVFIMFIVFFNAIIGLFALDTTNFNLSNYTFIQNLRTNLNNNHNWFTSILSVVLIPFLVIDGLIILLGLMALSFSIIPPLIMVFIYTPLVLIVFFTYIIPTIRGN